MQKNIIIAVIAGFCAGAAVAAVALSQTDGDERLAEKARSIVDATVSSECDNPAATPVRRQRGVSILIKQNFCAAGNQIHTSHRRLTDDPV